MSVAMCQLIANGYRFEMELRGPGKNQPLRLGGEGAGGVVNHGLRDAAISALESENEERCQ